MDTHQPPAWLDAEAYPFKSNHLLIDGHKMHYVDEGRGKPIVFVHGTPVWSFVYRNFIKALSAQGYRCIAPDHLGFGLSDKPSGYPYGVEQHAANFSAFVKKLGLSRYSLVVHDFGGPIGLHHAIEHPDQVDKVVSFNTFLWDATQEPAYQKARKILKSPLLPFLYLQFNFSAAFLVPKSFVGKPAAGVLKHYKAPFPSARHRHGPLGFAKSLLNAQPWLGKLWDKRAALAATPFLFLWGMKDPYMPPAYLERFRAGFPNNRVTMFGEAGHFVQEEAAEKALEAMRGFLREA